MPFKKSFEGTSSHTPQRHRVTNWRDYDAALCRFTEDVRADFRAQNRLDFRRIVRIGVVTGWPSQSRPLKGSPCNLRGFGSCERQFRRREPPIVEREEMAAYGRYRSCELCLAWMSALAAGDPDADVSL